ncbi:uncharacterized protein FFNC_15606 [Fusarium fujikuroi]|nr:uncharacterized protein FFNC_15606 [Fusarium fujikuroi]
MTSDFVTYLRHEPKFQTTIWELRGSESREPIHSDYFYKRYERALDSESNNWTGMESRADNPKLSLGTFNLDHFTFDVYVCEVGMRIDFETLDRMDSQTFYDHVASMDLAEDICAMSKAQLADRVDVEVLLKPELDGERIGTFADPL